MSKEEKEFMAEEAVKEDTGGTDALKREAKAAEPEEMVPEAKAAEDEKPAERSETADTEETAQDAEAADMASAAQEESEAAGMALAAEEESEAAGMASAAEESEASSEEEKEAPKEKKRSRREAKELAKKDAEIAELGEKHLRLMAEFDNFRKRSEKEKSEMYQVGATDTIDKILPVLDNFERAFALIEEEDKTDPFTEGIEKIYKQFLQVLTDMGVTPIEALGKEFDPNLHNAVMHVEDEDTGENIIVEELQKGYMYRDSVIRYAMVKVAN